jgi:hypothetical protein
MCQRVNHRRSVSFANRVLPRFGTNCSPPRVSLQAVAALAVFQICYGECGAPVRCRNTRGIAQWISRLVHPGLLLARSGNGAACFEHVAGDVDGIVMGTYPLGRSKLLALSAIQDRQVGSNGAIRFS